MKKKRNKKRPLTCINLKIIVLSDIVNEYFCGSLLLKSCSLIV